MLAARLPADDLRELGEVLFGSGHCGVFGYRIGDCRLLTRIKDEVVTIIVGKVARLFEARQERP